MASDAAPRRLPGLESTHARRIPHAGHCAGALRGACPRARPGPCALRYRGPRLRSPYRRVGPLVRHRLLCAAQRRADLRVLEAAGDGARRSCLRTVLLFGLTGSSPALWARWRSVRRRASAPSRRISARPWRSAGSCHRSYLTRAISPSCFDRRDQTTRRAQDAAVGYPAPARLTGAPRSHSVPRQT